MATRQGQYMVSYAFVQGQELCMRLRGICHDDARAAAAARCGVHKMQAVNNKAAVDDDGVWLWFDGEKLWRFN